MSIFFPKSSLTTNQSPFGNGPFHRPNAGHNNRQYQYIPDIPDMPAGSLLQELGDAVGAQYAEDTVLRYGKITLISVLAVATIASGLVYFR